MVIKNKFLLGLAIGIVPLLIAAGTMMVESITNTYVAPYTQCRTEADEDGADFESCIDLDGNEGDWGDRETANGWIDLTKGSISRGTCLELTMAANDGSGGTPDGDTLSFAVIAYRQKGPAKVVCAGTATLGSQDVQQYPDEGTPTDAAWWVDTFSVTDSWNGTVVESNSTDKASVASLWFDTCGYECFKVYTWDADNSNADEAGDITVWYSYW